MPKGSIWRKDPLSRTSWSCLIFLTLVILAVASNALAHRVVLFAYGEGDMVFTESYFSDGKRCQNSRIEVFDTFGNKLLEGKTDKSGEFSFKRPKPVDLRIVLTASMGHKDEYAIPAGELPEGEEGKASKLQPHEGISFIRVMGGIGFIFGIMGIILYFRSRRGR
ncbi:MAG: hypothetical protein ACE5I8_07145 [Thermodesulfobacteriota bacterium]